MNEKKEEKEYKNILKNKMSSLIFCPTFTVIFEAQQQSNIPRQE